MALPSTILSVWPGALSRLQPPPLSTATLDRSVHAPVMADKRRRKSLSIFRQKAEPAPPSSIPSSPAEKRTDEYQMPIPADSEQHSPKVRPRTLQKSNRTSVFGSLRSLHSLDEDEKAALTRSDSKASSVHDDAEMNIKGPLGTNVLQYGECQAAGSNVFRKRSQFLVLTESHLIRFRSQAKAIEMFPSIPTSTGRGGGPRTSSVGSYHELQMAAYADITTGIPLDQMVAVFKVDDGRPFFTVEAASLDERTRRASTTQLQLNDPHEAEVWMNAIRSAASQARDLLQRPIQAQTVEHLARVLERDLDYDPEHFQVFKVVQRFANRTGGRSSAEDLTKLGSAICYLAIGLHKVHLIPLQRSLTRSSSTSLNDPETTASWGITTLTAVHVQPGEDAFQLVFAPPLQPPHAVYLASSSAGQIALCLRFASEYLRPEWVRQPFVFDVPPELDDQMDPPNFPPDDHNCFDRTLIAYCAAYDVDTSRICYSVDYNCEDAPCFQLLPPSTGAGYTALELLAIFRALRYNESFTSISFAHIDLTLLRHLYDGFGADTDILYTRSGNPTNIHGHPDLPLLGQEIRALALKSRRLRRLDFTRSMPQPASVDGQPPHSCGIPEALTPLCKRSLTNVDWIVLTGIRLADSDLNYLVDAASERRCHFRALEIGECGLSVHDIDVLLSTLAVHESTMEVIDISGAQGRFSPEIFQREMAAFSHIRRLNLTRVQKTAGPEPLIAPETLLAWKLEALHLSQTAPNDQTVDSVSAYLASSKSDILRELHVNQCGLSGNDLAVLFRSMSRQEGQPRNMHVSANENRLKRGGSLLFQTIAQNFGPCSLAMRMMEFEKEHHFRELIHALTSNTTLRSLDLSRASLPYDASTETCEALKELFATNTTLEELDISGEPAPLDATQFGIGLNLALRGLEKNKTLKVLRIEHQGLGLQGATTLAEVLDVNDSLLEIYCEHNDINLQSFTVLVNALEKNHTLLYLSPLNHDRERSMDKVRREIEAMDRSEAPKAPKTGGGPIKKSLTGALSGRAHRHGHRHSSSVSSATSYTDQDVAAALQTLEDKWNHQVARMQKYLFRNYCRAQGLPSDGDTTQGGWSPRPGTADSLTKVLERVKLDRTPTVERPSTVNYMDEKLGERSPLVFHLPED